IATRKQSRKKAVGRVGDRAAGGQGAAARRRPRYGADAPLRVPGPGPAGTRCLGGPGEIGRYRPVVDRDRHRGRKSKSPSSFPHAGRTDTVTRIAPAVITMANTPTLPPEKPHTPPNQRPTRPVA